MGLRLRKRDAMSYNANQPHPYQPIEDAGMGALASGGWSRTSSSGSLTSIAVTNRYQRTTGCGVPGCGRPSDAEIHAPEE